LDPPAAAALARPTGPSARLDWWLGPGRYLLLGGALVALLAHHAWTDAWLGDFWIYLATVREFAENPAHPRNPLFGNDYPFAFLSPYFWALGIVARLGGWPPFQVLLAQGLVNLVLLLGALYAFVATWLRRRAAACYALLFLLFLWGREPWTFSSFFHLRSLSLVLPYPSTFAAALALGCLAGFRRLADSGRLAWLPLGAPLLALLLVHHPVNSLFLVIGLFAGSLDVARPLRAWGLLSVTIVLGVGLAFAWPLFPVRELWFAQAAQVHEGNEAMYRDPLPRVALALLGTPWLLSRLRGNRRDPVAWLGIALAALVAYGGLSGQWSYGRLLSHAVLMLQVSLAEACVALEERLTRWRGGAVLRHALAPALGALLVAGSWSFAVKPVLAESGRGDPRWLAFLESRVGHNDVVVTDEESCWYVASFSGKVVAFLMQLPFVPDHAERLRAVERFFEAGVPREEREAIVGRYGAAFVLLDKVRYADRWPALAQELRPLGRVVYASPEYELIRLGASERGPAPGRLSAPRP
jgi:alpha-1,6-mannosyltransferase